MPAQETLLVSFVEFEEIKEAFDANDGSSAGHLMRLEYLQNAVKALARLVNAFTAAWM